MLLTLVHIQHLFSLERSIQIPYKYIVMIAKPADKLKVVTSGQLCSQLNLPFQVVVTNYL